jgi:hypothetical protein
MEIVLGMSFEHRIALGCWREEGSRSQARIFEMKVDGKRHWVAG